MVRIRGGRFSKNEVATLDKMTRGNGYVKE